MDDGIACTTGGYRASSLTRVYAGLSSAGFRHVELTAVPGPKARIVPERMGPAEVEEIRKSLDAHRLRPVSMSGHCDLASLDGVRLFKARIDLAAQLGVTIINTGTSHDATPEAEERFFMNMQDVVPYARARGIRIALETHGGLTGTASDCLRTLDRLGSEWVGINYDTANVIYYRGVRPEQDLAKVASQVIHVHLKDHRGGKRVLDFPPLGRGDIDFEAVVSTLKAAGDRGPYSAEIEFDRDLTPVDEDRAMAETFRFMQRLVRAV